MISGKRLAPARLGTLYPRLSGMQIGIGTYEAVGGSGLGAEQVSASSVTPQVVAAPEAGNGDAQEVARRGAVSALATLVLFGTFCAASYGGYRVARSMQRAR